MKTLNDYFSKIYCINLDSRPDKYEECIEEFKKLNIDVERVSAIEGSLHFRAGLNRSSGAYGLLLTHIEILKDAMLNQYENILIFEDDVTFIDNLNEKFSEKISSLPDDWDLFYIGGNNVFARGKFELISGNKNFVITLDNYRTINYELCKTTWTQTTHAVGFNSKFYKTTLEAIRNNSTLPVDVIYTGLQQKGYNAYTFLPSLALQRPSFSDIENKYVDYGNNKANGF